MNSIVSEKLSVLTSSPGVYIMKDEHNEIIYIGKAKNLKNRVSSYFVSNSSHSLKVMRMVAHIRDFEYIVTGSELEALILENNLIKQHKPKYNILLKDDKSYPYIVLDKKSDYPSFNLARKRKDDGMRYFGPFSSSTAVWEIIRTLNSVFGLYGCKHKFPKEFGKFRPCLNYHIGRCPGVCTGKISPQEYKRSVDNAISFLGGNYKKLVIDLEEEMQQLAENLQFEKAAAVRDRINNIKKLEAKQVIVTSPNINRDVIAYSTLDSDVCFSVMHIRAGKIIFQDTFFIPDSEDQLLTVFIERYYTDSFDIPKDILVGELPENHELLESWLTDKKGSNVRIFDAKRGETIKLVDMCRKNAEEKLADKKANGIRTGKLMLHISQMLGLSSSPLRFEMYDISNFGSDSVVGGMIVWQNGRFSRKDYRKFNFDNAHTPDDYLYTRTMIQRRLERLDNMSEGFEMKPDIIFIDGGLGHLNAVADLFENRDIKVFGLVKDRKHRTRAVVTQNGEVDLRTNPAVFKFFTNLQDEVHRFAISHMQNKKKKSMINSQLLSIEGIGKAKYKAIMDKFKTVSAVKKATAEELCSVEGISLEIANRIIKYFNEENK